MVFTLEALDADHGDALLLHYGDQKSPGLIVIDGGPAGVYEKSLKKRLDEIRAQRKLAEGRPLPIPLLMVSHIDDDHINGVLDLFTEMSEARENEEPRRYSVATLWLNSFDQIVGKGSAAMVEALSAKGPPAAHAASTWQPSVPLDEPLRAVVASIPQAQKLMGLAGSLGTPTNSPFKDRMVTAVEGKVRFAKFGKLKLSVVGPLAPRVDKLQAQWEEYVAKQEAKKKAAGQAAEYLDKSVYNLSSIVVLAEAGGKRILLTGDGRGDDILKGLEAAGFLKPGGEMHVDLLKLPHHGSSRNVDTDFFERIKADHYVGSGNGKYDNPETKTLKMIVDARGDDKYTIHLTYPKPAGAAKFLKDQAAKRKNLTVVYRDPAALSMSVKLA